MLKVSISIFFKILFILPASKDTNTSKMKLKLCPRYIYFILTNNCLNRCRSHLVKILYRVFIRFSRSV